MRVRKMLDEIRCDMKLYLDYLTTKILKQRYFSKEELPMAAHKALVAERRIMGVELQEYGSISLSLKKYAIILDLICAIDGFRSDEVKMLALGLSFYHAPDIKLYWQRRPDYQYILRQPDNTWDPRDTRGAKLVESLKTKISMPKFNDYIALMYATKNGDIDKIKALLSDPTINVNEKDSQHQTALMYGAYWNQTQAIKILLRVSCIDVNAANKNGKTALMIAAQLGHTEIVRTLLAVPGINVNAFTQDGETALILATKKGYSEIIKLLKAVPDTLVINRDFCCKLDALPQDILLEIAKLLPIRGFFSLGAVNKRLQSITKNPIFSARQTERAVLNIEDLQLLLDEINKIIVNSDWIDELNPNEFANFKLKYIRLRALAAKRLAAGVEGVQEFLRVNAETFNKWNNLLGLDRDDEGYPLSMNDYNWNREWEERINPSNEDDNPWQSRDQCRIM